ncbi:hypothetical protein llap_12845 [Limosa lapponica baueri]|uniref:Uncharacterized protein n=1 Tax=Limosa lapponica baueri TaxID=1758121 RepID=A0A2I0TST5_LIMLA|nr:hypothetical protein llap_12845 [Limosa lapponica baueri]
MAHDQASALSSALSPKPLQCGKGKDSRDARHLQTGTYHGGKCSHQLPIPSAGHRAGRRHHLLHGEDFLPRAWDVSKPNFHVLEKVEHPKEDGEKGGLQKRKELLVVEGEAKEINELSLANGSEKSLNIYI